MKNRHIHLRIAAAILAMTLVPRGASHALDLVVTSNGDDGDANPGNGFCAAPGMFASCTLRAAVEEANARSTTPSPGCSPMDSRVAI